MCMCIVRIHIWGDSLSQIEARIYPTGTGNAIKSVQHQLECPYSLANSVMYVFEMFLEKQIIEDKDELSL